MYPFNTQLAKGIAISFFVCALAAVSGVKVMNNMNQLQEQVSGKVVIDYTTSLAKSSKPSIPQYCFNSSVWNGSWDLNEKLEMPVLKPPAEVDLAQRYHSHFESLCNMTDILRLASSEVVSGHMNDAMELEVVKRMKGLRGETLLQLGTSVDSRLIRFGCPLFGVERNVYHEGDIGISYCVIPVINFTIVHVFNDALTKAYMPIEKQVRRLEEINTVVAKVGIQAPRFIVLSGIEWDFKWYKDHKMPIDWSEIHSITMRKVSLFQKQFPMAKALFVRTQPFTRSDNDCLASQESYQKYNNLFHEVARKFNPDQNICGGVHVGDLAHLMLFNGTQASGWSDGIHPSGWVSMQFMNILFNVMSLIGEACGH